MNVRRSDQTAPARDDLVQRIAAILWPSFLTAGAATSVTFALFDPATRLPELDRVAVYSCFFLLLWASCAIACAGALYVAAPVPESIKRAGRDR